MVRLAKELQFAKACLPIRVTECGIVKKVKEVQLAKAWSPISLTEMMKLANELQFLKEPGPICSTESGMFKLVKELQCANASAPICLTELGMVKLVKELQCTKASAPICVTELGMFKLIKDLHFLKEQGPIWITECGMTTRSKPHPWNALHPIEVKSVGICTWSKSWWKPARAQQIAGGTQNTTCTLAPGGMNICTWSVSSSVSRWPSTTSSTVVRALMSVSSDGWNAFRASFNSRSVMSGVTSKVQILPLISSTSMVLMAPELLDNF